MANETAALPYTPQNLLEHWLGHRRLTRKTLEAFPQDKLFSYALGGMRPFGELVHEFLGMALPVANQVANGTWGSHGDKPTDKEALLRLWDEHTEKIRSLVPTIPAERYQASIRIYDQWEVTGMEAIEYTIDNEIHHRGQGFVYLRTLGIEPPAFYDRS